MIEAINAHFYCFRTLKSLFCSGIGVFSFVVLGFFRFLGGNRCMIV